MLLLVRLRCNFTSEVKTGRQRGGEPALIELLIIYSNAKYDDSWQNEAMMLAALTAPAAAPT